MTNTGHDIELAMLLKILQANEIKSVTVEYSGGGDSGGIDENDLPPEIAKKEYLFPTQYQGSMPISLDEIVSNVLVEMMPRGFENGEGGKGTITLFSDGLLEHGHIDYIQDYLSDEYDGEDLLSAEGVSVILNYMRRTLDGHVNNIADPSEISDISNITLNLSCASDDEDCAPENISVSVAHGPSHSLTYLYDDVTEEESAALSKIIENFTSDNMSEYCQQTFTLTAFVNNGEIDTSSLHLESGYFEQTEYADCSERQISTDVEVDTGILTIYTKGDEAGFYLDKSRQFLRTAEINGKVCIKTIGDPFETPIDANSGYYAVPTANNKSWRPSSIDLLAINNPTGTNEVVRIGFGLDGLHYEILERPPASADCPCNSFVCKENKVIDFSLLCDNSVAMDIRAKTISYIESKLPSADHFGRYIYRKVMRDLAIDHIKQFAETAPLDEVGYMRKISQNGEIRAIFESSILLRQSELLNQEQGASHAPSPLSKRRRI